MADDDAAKLGAPDMGEIHQAMAADDGTDLTCRVERLERLLGQISGQVGLIRPELPALGAAQQAGFEDTGGLLRSTVARLDTLNSQVWSLRDDLPVILGDAMTRSRCALD